MPQPVFIGLGSNMLNPKAQVVQGVKAISVLPSVTLTACSSLYLSPPLGDIKQADFINAVVSVTTTLSPAKLFAALLCIEAEQHRIRTLRWGLKYKDEQAVSVTEGSTLMALTPCTTCALGFNMLLPNPIKTG